MSESSKKKPVICVETGKVFPSARKASLSMNKNIAAVSISIQKKVKCGGYHWEYI